MYPLSNLLILMDISKKTILGKMEVLDLVDIWREQHPDTKRYTWRKTGHAQRARLDFFLTSLSLIPFVDKSDIIPGIDSDHSIIALDIDFSRFQRGAGFFKFNNSLL